MINNDDTSTKMIMGNNVKVKIMNFEYNKYTSIDVLNKQMETRLNEFFKDKYVLNVSANIIDAENSISYIIFYKDESSTEAKILVNRVRKADPNAFINVIKTDFLEGHFYQKTDY